MYPSIHRLIVRRISGISLVKSNHIQQRFNIQIPTQTENISQHRVRRAGIRHLLGVEVSVCECTRLSFTSLTLLTFCALPLLLVIVRKAQSIVTAGDAAVLVLVLILVPVPVPVLVPVAGTTVHVCLRGFRFGFCICVQRPRLWWL
jgi:hypothetical protein